MNAAHGAGARRARHGVQLLGVAALLAAACASGAAPSYTIAPAQSSLSFIGIQQGEKFTGRIPGFDAKVRYAPDDLPGSGLDVTIRVASIDTKSPDRDATLAGADWFDFAKFPTATFRTVAIRATPAGPVADADLTIKGVTRRILFPFTWAASGAAATLDARVTLNRLDFGIGAGEWADDSMVGRKVEVMVHLALTAAPAPTAAPAAPPKKHR
jgi:polyisoprenoid-binding protein YceI